MRRWAWLLPLLAVAAVFVLRVSGPPDFLDKDQPRPIDYILDAAADGNWVVQRDSSGAPNSKPPLYTWLAAGTSLVLGGNRLALYLPCGLAMAGLVLLAWAWTRRRLGWSAGLAAAMAMALANDTQKAITLARTDAVFAVTIAATAWATLRAWERGHGWLLFWLLAAISTLAKSPLGLVFAAGGLLAALWQRREADCLPLRPAWRAQGLGFTLFLLIAGGWFALAVVTLGQPVIERMLERELVGHAIANDKGTPLWQTFWRPPLWHAAVLLPFSIPAVAAIIRLVRSPPPSPRRRRFLRFMVCWLAVGLAVLCLAPHKRMILALPLVLPATILAGAELGHWLRRWSVRRQLAAWTVAAVLALGGLAAYHATRDEAKDRIAPSRAVLAAADALAAQRARGATIAIADNLPAPLRYFTPGWPAPLPAKAVTAFLASPGPRAVAVRAGAPAPADVQRLAVAPGIDVLVRP